MKLFAYKVRLHMKSGAILLGYATRLTKRTEGNDLTNLEWRGNMPFYFRLDDVSAVTVSRVLNWRWLFRS